jgi:hypothetical protein
VPSRAVASEGFRVVRDYLRDYPQDSHGSPASRREGWFEHEQPSPLP